MRSGIDRTNMQRARLARMLAAAVGVMATAAWTIADQIRLSSGETLRVSDVTIQGDQLVCRHPVLGILVIPRQSVLEHIIEPDSVAPAPKQATAASVPPAPPPTPPGAVTPPAPSPDSNTSTEPPSSDDINARQKARAEAIVEADKRFDDDRAEEELKKTLNTASLFTGWKGTIEAGGSGTDGNTENFNLRAGVGFTRTAELLRTRLDASYLYSTEAGLKSQSRGVANALNDWFFRESPWGLFAKGRAEYDEFQDWDWRLSAFAGPSYLFWESDASSLRGRLGAGASKELGSSRNEVIPEGLAGLDFRYQFTPRQSMFADAEYLPSLSDFPEYRFNLRAGYEFLVDPVSKLRMRLGVENRYNSSPGTGFKSNDIEYFALLGLEF